MDPVTAARLAARRSEYCHDQRFARTAVFVLMARKIRKSVQSKSQQKKKETGVKPQNSQPHRK